MGERACRVVGGPEELLVGVEGGVGNRVQSRVHGLELRPLAPHVVLRGLGVRVGPDGKAGWGVFGTWVEIGRRYGVILPAYAS